jgi:hypothetical protein
MDKHTCTRDLKFFLITEEGDFKRWESIKVVLLTLLSQFFHSHFHHVRLYYLHSLWHSCYHYHYYWCLSRSQNSDNFDDYNDYEIMTEYEQIRFINSQIALIRVEGNPEWKPYLSNQ